MDKRKTRRTM